MIICGKMQVFTKRIWTSPMGFQRSAPLVFFEKIKGLETYSVLADREGFEPPNEFPRYALSKRAH